MARELEKLISRLDIKCDEISQFSARPTKVQTEALVRLCREVITEFYREESSK